MNDVYCALSGVQRNFEKLTFISECVHFNYVECGETMVNLCFFCKPNAVNRWPVREEAGEAEVIFCVSVFFHESHEFWMLCSHLL